MGRPTVLMATSGGADVWPYFFQGQMRCPRLTALALRSLSRMVAKRFHLPAMMRQRLGIEADPVVTSGGGWLRFEGFSSCCSTYARVDLSPDCYSGIVVENGTTNVDFNRPFRAMLAEIRDGESVGLAVGSDDVTLLRGEEQVTERKVELPLRWVKSFCEMQAFEGRMERRCMVGRNAALAFLRSIPAQTTSAAEYWVVPSGQALRLSQRSAEGGIRLTGIERLRLLLDLAPYATGLEAFADARNVASEWVVHLGAVRFHLALSAEVWRGFSGEGQALEQLAQSPNPALLDAVRQALKWQAELRPAEFAADWGEPLPAICGALAALASGGLAGFDVVAGAHFHRELPFDLSLVEDMHPRLKSARELVDAGAVRLKTRTDEETSAEVLSGGVCHTVKLTRNSYRCTCPWFAKHQDERGPCKHVLAVKITSESDQD